MSTRAKIAWVLGFAILVSLLAVRSADAKLGPADEYGRVHVAAIQALADAITHNSTPTYCVPTSEQDYGWVSDRGDPNQGITETSASDGSDNWTIDWSNVQINLSGDICSQLERLTRYPATAGYFRQKQPTREPRAIKKGGKPPKSDRYNIWPNYNTYDASVGVLTLVHESLHVALQSTDEGLVECTAVKNLWPTIAALHLPGTLGKQIIADALDNHWQAPPEYLTHC